MKKNEPAAVAAPSQHNYIFLDFNLAELSTTHILNHSADMPATERRGYFDIQPDDMVVDYAAFRLQWGGERQP